MLKATKNRLFLIIRTTSSRQWKKLNQSLIFLCIIFNHNENCIRITVNARNDCLIEFNFSLSMAHQLEYMPNSEWECIISNNISCSSDYLQWLFEERRERHSFFVRSCKESSSSCRVKFRLLLGYQKRSWNKCYKVRCSCTWKAIYYV